MTSHAFHFLLVFLLFLPLQARESMDFQYGPRPPQAIFDPDDILDPRFAKELSGPLAKHFSEEGVDVIVVILKDIHNAPPEHVAGQFAAAWCDSLIHCVVLHVPGRADSPWIVPHGRLVEHLKKELVETEVADSERRARAETDDAHKVKAAAEEASDLLRIWMGNAIEHSKKIQTEAARIRRELENYSRKQRIGLFSLIASFLLLLAVCAYLIRIFRRRGPRHFPNHQWQTRLGAPYSGGNHSVRDLGSHPPRS